MIFVISNIPPSFAKVASVDGYDHDIVDVSLDKSESFPSLSGNISVTVENMSQHDTSVIRIQYLSYSNGEFLNDVITLPKTIIDRDTYQIPYSMYGRESLTLAINVLPPEDSREPLHKFDQLIFSFSIDDINEPIPITTIDEEEKVIFKLSSDRPLSDDHIVQLQLEGLIQTCSKTEVYRDGEMIPIDSPQMNIGANYDWKASDVEVHCYNIVNNIPVTTFILPVFADVVTDLNSLIDSIEAKIIPRDLCYINQIDCKILNTLPTPKYELRDNSKSLFEPNNDESTIVTLTMISIGVTIVSITVSVIAIIISLRHRSTIKLNSYRKIPEQTVSKGGSPFGS